ncbi:MAG: Tad domain-containing protein [Pseudomonadota bacterium]|nr:Tad domain-containing protein [Pseudomonadota bacterium]
MRRVITRHHQHGAVIVTVALLMLFLLGFIGIALDFGRLFIVKTELQTALDSCALAAAQELDGAIDAKERAISAGMTAGNLNNVNLQSSTWDNQKKIVDADITFRDAAYTETSVSENARYAQCQHMQSGIRMWLIQSIGAFSNSPATYPNTQNVGALAVATRGSSQTSCSIPVALMKKPGTSAPNYGYQVGEWVKVIGDRTAGSGEIGWYNLDGSTNARSAKDQLEGGTCGVRVGDQLGTPGSKTALDVVWNYRFGIYKNSDDPSIHRPDFSGYSYTTTNWKNSVPQNAWSGTPAAGSHPTAENFIAKRAAFSSFDNTGSDLKNGSQVVYGDPNKLNSFKNLATPGAGGQHKKYGFNRRVATVPVIDDSRRVVDYLCIFMLHPLSGPNDDAFLEFRGNAGALNSPCTSSGLAGGSAGPLVPVLVR